MEIIFKEDSTHKNDTDLVREYIKKCNGDFGKAGKALWDDGKKISIIFAKSAYVIEDGEGLAGEDYLLYIDGKFTMGYEGLDKGIGDLDWIIEETKKFAKEKDIILNNDDFNYILRSLDQTCRDEDGLEKNYFITSQEAEELFNRELIVKE